MTRLTRVLCGSCCRSMGWGGHPLREAKCLQGRGHKACVRLDKEEGGIFFSKIGCTTGMCDIAMDEVVREVKAKGSGN